MKREKKVLETEESIDSLRKEIDVINNKIVDLLKERFELVKKIGHIKKEKGMDVFVPLREKEIFEKIFRIREHVPQESIERIFRAIIEESRKYEM